MNQSIIKFIKVLLIVPIIFLFSWSISVSNSDVCIDDALLKRANRYYELEKKQLWEKTYEFRTPLYRKSISKKFYVNKMHENNRSWKLLNYKLIECIIDINYAIYTVEFIEKVPDSYFPNNIRTSIKLIQNTTWEKLKGIWYVRGAGDRTHLSLNGDMVMRNDQRPISIDR